MQRRLSRDESLLLYSDGLLEARTPEGSEFGTERISHAFGRTARDSRDARSLVNGVLANAREHDVAFEDDVTLLAIRF